MRSLEQAQLFSALNTLTDRQLRRLYWHNVLERSYAEIARIENVSEFAIRDCIERTITKLKKLL